MSVNINITMITFLFGIPGNDYNALNQILLELKKSIFYSCTEELSSNAFCEQFKAKLQKIIIKEKHMISKSNIIEQFFSKRTNLTAIYDFRGPDLRYF